MLVVDFMHEFELGVWKALLTHIIRILYAQGGADLVAKFDKRYTLHVILRFQLFILVTLGSGRSRALGKIPLGSLQTTCPE